MPGRVPAGRIFQSYNEMILIPILIPSFIMIKTTLKVEGMACEMCESHVNDAVRRLLGPVKVVSSHRRAETVIWSDTPPDAEALRAAVGATGYTPGECRSEEARPDDLLARLRGFFGG